MSIMSSNVRATLYPGCNGTGRDTYIAFNNGGNTCLYKPETKGIAMGGMRRSM